MAECTITVTVGQNGEIIRSLPIVPRIDPRTNEVVGVDENTGQVYPISQLEKMARNGDPVAQSTMGDYYNSQFNQDYEKAWYWYKKAADQGYAKAQWNIGTLYAVIDRMLGGDKDLTDPVIAGIVPMVQNLAATQNIDIKNARDNSLMWFKKSAEQGYLEAMFVMGRDYSLNKEYEKALHWLEKADKYGHPEAKQLIEVTKIFNEMGL